MMRFDWYQATFYGDVPPGVLLDSIASDLPRASRIDHGGRGRNGYRNSAVIRDVDGHALATMFHGGNNGARPNIVASGPDAPAFAHCVREKRLDHGVTRGDVCLDMEGEDFHRIAGDVRRIIKRHGMNGLSWVPDDPETGPTYYAGKPTSDIRFRVYRKDLQLIALGCDPAEFPQPIVRGEAQIRPRTATRRAFAWKQPDEFLGASRWLRSVSNAVLEHNPRAIVMQKREPTSFDQKLTWLRTQAVGILKAIQERNPTDEALGRFLREEVIEFGLKSC